MHVVVLGSSGNLGSHVCVELLERGHEVVGIARSPSRIGEHERYRPISLDITNAVVEEFVEILRGAEVLIWSYSPSSPQTAYSKLFIIVNMSRLASVEDRLTVAIQSLTSKQRAA